MTDYAILDFLRSQIDEARRHAGAGLIAYPRARAEDIQLAEETLGFELPPLLKRIYLEIGNGGRRLGPGYGLFGVPGGYYRRDDDDLVARSQEMARDYAWWNPQAVVVCSWGGNMLSCIDCSDDMYTVYRFDGNFLGDYEGEHDPPDAAWDIEADTFAEWLVEQSE